MDVSSQQSAPDRGPERTLVDHWGPIAVTTLAFALVLARLWLVFRRLYDPDELEHLHAGFCVWQGLVPYRDFFDHHGAVLWYLSLPLFELWGPSLKVLFTGRLIIWLVGTVSVILTWYLGNLLYGRWAGPVAALLLVTLPAFQEKNVEWRPDNVAVLLVLMAVLGVCRSQRPRGWLWSGLVGLCLAAAFYCTQKAAFTGLGMTAGFLVAALRQRDPQGLQKVVGLLAGAVLIAAIVCLMYATAGVLREYTQMTILLPLQWRAREPKLPYLVDMLSSAPIFWGTFVLGLILNIFQRVGDPTRSPGATVVTWGAAAHAIGLLLVPAAFKQYYLPLMPLAALLGASALVGLAGRSSEPAAQRLGRWKVFLALLPGTAVLMVGLLLRTGYPFFHPAWTISLSAGILLGVVASLGGARRLGVLVLLLSGAIGATPWLWLQFRWDHRDQTEAIERLMAATEADDRFFDGFTGYGALRPHAFFYYWINQHSWAMIPQRDRVEGVLEALAHPATRVVLYDEYLQEHLPDTVERYLEEHFARDQRYGGGPGCVVWVKLGRELQPPGARQPSGS